MLAEFHKTQNWIGLNLTFTEEDGQCTKKQLSQQSISSGIQPLLSIFGQIKYLSSKVLCPHLQIRFK